jgi:hypothetical protein
MGVDAMTNTDEGKRDAWNRRPRMTRDEKLEPIREMKAQLMSGETRSLDADTHRARSWKVRARCGRGGTGRRIASPNEAIIRSAYEGFAEGNLARMLQSVDPDLEWTYLDPADRIRNPRSVMDGMSWRPH